MKGINAIVTALYPSGPADLAKLSVGDEIVAVNDFALNGELDKWLSYFDDDAKTVTVLRGGKMLSFTFPEVNRNFYNKYSVSKITNPSNDQKRAFENWKK